MNNQNNNRPQARNIPPNNPVGNGQRPDNSGNMRPNYTGQPGYRNVQRNVGNPVAQRPTAPRNVPNGTNNAVRPQTKNAQQQYPPVRHISRKQARKNAIVLGITCVVIVLLLIAVVIFAARCTMNLAGIGTSVESGTSEVTDTVEQTAGTDNLVIPETEPIETEPVLDPNYEYIEKTAADIHKGYQILINYENAYEFNGDFNFKTLYSAKNGLYKVSNTSDSIDVRALDAFVSMMSAFGDATGNHDIIITSADRTYEFQEQLYAERVEMYGEDYARLYVAEPGHSEHHSGLALDLAIYTDGGRGYTFDDKPEYGDWMHSNSYKFGYIERYQAAKTPITKIAYENWHYRYIGKPHAYYITANDLCLEEYIELLYKHGFDDRLSFTDDEGASWEVYYVAADEWGTTKVPVPKFFDYEVSGNNVDGFIVTVSFKSE